MEHISKTLSKAGREKSLATTSPRPPQWGGILLTLAQSRSKELTSAEIRLWQAKLSGYRDSLVEWALVAYNGEFFPNPSTICRMIEVKLEAEFQEIQNREWPAWKATQAQAEAEGRLATDDDYERLRAECREIMARAPVITAEGRPHGKAADKQAAVQGNAGDTAPDSMASGQSADTGR